MNSINKCLAIAAIAFMVVSCGSSAIYEANIDIPRESWNIDSTAIFKVEVTDTASVHNIYINIRNTTSYQNSNLFLFVQTTSPMGATLNDTIECFLADPRGNWLGKGFGALRDNQVPYKKYIRFPDEGTYTFNVQQGMRTQSLKGIASIGLRVERQK
jgi:gliding motility-associated lipoprotein GldH